MSRFILYGTSACHLCEIAEQMLEAASAADSRIEFAKIDISDSDSLFERYGVKIPVLRHEDGRELDWPFDELQLREFLGS